MTDYLYQKSEAFEQAKREHQEAVDHIDDLKRRMAEQSGVLSELENDAVEAAAGYEKAVVLGKGEAQAQKHLDSCKEKIKNGLRRHEVIAKGLEAAERELLSAQRTVSVKRKAAMLDLEQSLPDIDSELE